MRTTLDLDEDVHRAARALARTEGKSMGRVVSALVRKGLNSSRAHARRAATRFPVFALPPDSPPVTADSVRRALDGD